MAKLNLDFSQLKITVKDLEFALDLLKAQLDKDTDKRDDPTAFSRVESSINVMTMLQRIRASFLDATK